MRRPSIARNVEIARKYATGKVSQQQLAVEYGLTSQRIGKIIANVNTPKTEAPRPMTFHTDDFKVIRELVYKYSLPGVLRELARVADLYGDRSMKWKTVARRLRTLDVQF